MGRIVRFLSIVGVAALLACDESPEMQALGSVDITTTGSVAPVTTSDGWVVTFDRFIVHITAVNVAGTDRVLAASATPQIVDLVAPGPKPLLSATVRTARTWEDVNLQIAPPEPETDVALLPPITEADRDLLLTNRFSTYVEAKATKGPITKVLRWGFGTNTSYKDCFGDLNGTTVRGIVIPPNGNDTADVLIGPSVLFRDELVAGESVFRLDAIAAADANNDGVVSLDELRAAPLTTARTAGARYGVGEETAIVDLGAFVEALARRTVLSFRSAGGCRTEPQL